MTEPLVIEPVVQKSAADCGVACLAMLLGLPYPQVRDAAPRRVGEDGLSTRQMRSLAKRLGHTIHFQKHGDFSETIGIIDLQRPTVEGEPKGEWDGHYVMVLKGVIYNPADGHLWTDIDTFFSARRWRPLGVFVRDDGEALSAL